jgi:CHASE2 domain-containing sensor protein
MLVQTLVLLAVLLVMFFYIGKGYARRLRGRDVPPGTADTAGWLLFLGLAFLATAAIGAWHITKFLNVALSGTLLVFGIASLIAAFITARR